MAVPYAIVANLPNYIDATKTSHPQQKIECNEYSSLSDFCLQATNTRRKSTDPVNGSQPVLQIVSTLEAFGTRALPNRPIDLFISISLVHMSSAAARAAFDMTVVTSSAFLHSCST